MEQPKKETEATEKAAAEKKTKADQALIAKACKAYGIAAQYLFASRIDGNAVVLVTNGGSRVRYTGAKVERLDRLAVTGINPALAKRKVIAGKAKK